MTYFGNWEVDKYRFGLMPVNSITQPYYMNDVMPITWDGSLWATPEWVRTLRQSKVREAKVRARTVTWHKGNKRRLTRREKVARGIPRGR